MRPSTATALATLNRRFYRQSALDFDSTRRAPWRGWELLIERLDLGTPIMPRRSAELAPELSVVDVGCGNGRFAKFLLECLPDFELYYRGLDSSPELLDLARADLDDLPRCSVELEVVDVLGNEGDGCPSLVPAQKSSELGTRSRSESGADRGADLVVAFGLFHHVPRSLQPGLLDRMSQATASGGSLCLSFWPLLDQPRLARRVVPWQRAVDLGLLSSDQRDEVEALDDGDLLLQWGSEGAETLRYCRHDSLDHAQVLLAGKEAEFFKSQEGADRGNLYALVRL